MLRRQPRRSPEGAGMSRLRKPPKRAKSFNFYLLFFFFPLPLSLRLKAIFVPRVVVPRRPAAPALPSPPPTSAPRGRWDGAAFFFARRRFLLPRSHKLVTSFTRKHWRVPRSGSNLFFSARAEGGRLSLPLLLLRHTCPSASSSSAPGVFGPFSQAAFSAAFSAPVLLAASCERENKAERVGRRRRERQAGDSDAGDGYGQPSSAGQAEFPPFTPHLYRPLPEAAVVLAQRLLEVKPPPELLGKVWDPLGTM